MQFDLGDILTRAWKITWHNKKLWGYAIIPFLLWVLYFPLFLIFFPMSLYPDPSLPGPLRELMQWPGIEGLFLAGSLALIVLALILYLFSSSALTLGVVRAEQGEELPGFFALFRASLRYVGAILGASLLIGLLVTIVFVAFTACSAVVSMITFGIGSIFTQLLLYPIMFVVWVGTEQTQSGIVADDLGATDSISRAWDLITSNIWKYLIVGVVIYVVRSMVAGFMLIPLMAPMWFIVMGGAMMESTPDPNMLMLSGLCMLAFMPVYVIFMGFATTYTRSAFVVLYRRLTRDSQARQEFLKAIESQESK